MKKINLLLLLFVMGFSVSAQNYLNGSLQLSNFKYPGLNAEFEKVLRVKPISKKTKKGKELSKERQFLGFANLGYYANANSHLGLLNTYGIKYQKLTRSQFYYNTGLGLGFNTNFLGETYTVEDDGTVEQKSGTRSYFATQLNLGLGRQFKKYNRLDAVFIRQNIHVLLNYNYSSLPIFNTEIGVRFKLNHNKTLVTRAW